MKHVPIKCVLLITCSQKYNICKNNSFKIKCNIEGVRWIIRTKRNMRPNELYCVSVTFSYFLYKNIITFLSTKVIKLQLLYETEARIN